MRRSTWLCVLATAVACWSAAMGAPAATSRPNVVVLLSDDQGSADYGFVSPTPDVKTPHLDALAREGTYFARALATCPVCSPSRAGIMTGRYPQRAGDYWFHGDPKRAGLPAGVRTTAEYLREAGYATGYVGKVHYDGGTPAPGNRLFPTRHGFGHFFGSTTGGTIHYLLHSERAIREQGAERARQHAIAPLWLDTEPQRGLDGFTTDLFAADAVAFVRAHAGRKPFYLHVAFNAVHTAVKQVPPEEARRRGFDLDEEGNAIAPLRTLYLAQLELLDAAVGRIIAALRDTGELDDTLVIFTTDNGGGAGSRNTPLAGGKYHLSEGGVRCPIIARFPKRFAADERSEAAVSHLDILPTILEAAGVAAKPGTLDGRSLARLAADPAETADRPLFHDTGFQWSVHQGDWKLLVTHGEEAAAALETKYKITLVRGTNLFDLRTDPGEKTNLAAEHPDVVARLTRLHGEWRTGCPSPGQPAIAGDH